jgi:CubicO group peptidase (beta-lactamase class C family)
MKKKNTREIYYLTIDKNKRRIQMNPVRKLSIIFIYLIISVLVVSCNNDDPPTSPDNTSDGYIYNVPEQVNDGWETASMSEVGMDQTIIVNLMNDLLNREHFIHSIVVVKNGKLVFEEYFSGRDVELDEQVAGSGELKYTSKNFDRNTLHFQGSANKSFWSALIGIGIAKGFINGTDEKMFSFFPDYEDLSNTEKDKITIAHMLTMTSGLPWDDGSYPIYDPRNDEYQMLFNEDPVRFVLEKPVVTSPGTNFHYNSGTTLLLSEIVKRSSGKSLADFVEQFLFTPLGIISYRWASSRNSHNTIFAAGLYLRPRDMAKFGQLYLQEGLWDANRIVSDQWTLKSSGESIHFPTVHPPMPNFITGYGYQWWVGKFTNLTDVYCAAGWGGQFIMVLPDVNIIVVFTGGDFVGNNFQLQFDIVNDFILSALL